MNTTYLAAIEFTLSVTAPIFLIVFLGLYLKKTGRISEDFISVASKLVFNICLPILMFLAIIESQVDLREQWDLTLFAASAAVISFYVFWWLSPLFTQRKEERGVAVQSAFRSNLAIVGIALCAKAFGEPGLAVGALLLAVVTPIYNVLSIYALTHCLQQQQKLQWGKLLWSIITNPLIMAIILAFVFLALNLRLPVVLEDTAGYLSRMTLPLALLTIGGSVSLSSLKESRALSMSVVAAKLVVLPLAVMAAALLCGFRGVELGCLILMFASPTAAAAFVMVRAIGGSHQLASNTIALSTILSALTISVMLFGFRTQNLF